MAIGLRVLVTGSMGKLGRAAVRELRRRGHFVRGFDLVADPHADDSVVGNINDPVAVGRAAEGMQALVHLAAIPDDDDFLTRLLPVNLAGTYVVFEAARIAGIKRVVLASSGQVVWWQRFTGPLPIRADDEFTPRGWYAAGKVFLEAAGRVYAESHGMSVIAARLGWCPRDVNHVAELKETPWGPDVYLSAADGGRFFACAVESTQPFKFAVVYVCSHPASGTITYDPAPARDLLGYEPQDRWPDGATDDLSGSV